MIGMDADTVALTSIAKKMKASGRGVAIMSSVCIDDATPASFYATVPSRHQYHSIASQGAASGFDLLAGAYFRDPYGVRAHTQGNVFAEYQASGYTVVRGRDGYTLPQDASRVLWLDNDSTTEIDFSCHDGWYLTKKSMTCQQAEIDGNSCNATTNSDGSICPS